MYTEFKKVKPINPPQNTRTSAYLILRKFLGISDSLGLLSLVIGQLCLLLSSSLSLKFIKKEINYFFKIIKKKLNM